MSRAAGFTLHVPKLIFGYGAVTSLPVALADLGVQRPLLITDRGLQAHGVFDKVHAALVEHRHSTVFADVPENPTFDAVDRAAAVYRDNACDVVVAVGGGSVIDTSKLVAVLAGHSGTARDYVGHSARVTASTAPLVVLPTTAGTGSEASPDAGVHPAPNVVSSGITSPYIVPRVAICDPELTLTLPPRLTAATAIDALSHGIEGFLSTATSPLADVLALDGIRRVWNHMQAATHNGQDRDARGQLMLGAFSGGVAIGKGLGPAHAIAISLGDQGLHHGVLSGLGLIATIELMREMAPEKVAIVAQAMGLSPGSRIDLALRDRMATLDLPVSLHQLGYRMRNVRDLAAAAAASHFNFTSPYHPGVDEYERLIRTILD